MKWRERGRVALRYTFAHGQGHLSTFLSSLSMLGLVLAIALLIVVLSVMNGFDREMRERILALVPHITLYSHKPMQEWEELARQALSTPGIVGAAPFTEFDALFMRGREVEAAKGIGIALDAVENTRLLEAIPRAQREQFQAQADSVVLGAGLATRLQLGAGDQVTLVVPGGGLSGQDGPTRFQALQVAGVLHSGTELDESLALLHLATASRLAGLDGAVSGLRLVTRDIFSASRLGWELVSTLPPGYFSTNWMMTHGNLYAAIQLSRELVSLLLFSIIAVAAFNVVSSLVLVVFDKRGDVAILRTLGGSRGDIAWVFILQGAMIGLVGVLAGSALGAALSQVVPALVNRMERATGFHFLNTDVYPVSFLPVDLQFRDILVVGGVALLMCLLAAVYPARRAAKLAPAVVLNEDRG